MKRGDPSEPGEGDPVGPSDQDERKPKMKTILLAVSALGVIGLGAVAAQPLIQAAPFGPPPPHIGVPPSPPGAPYAAGPAAPAPQYAPHPRGAHPAPPQPHQAQAPYGPAVSGELSGQVERFMLNPHGEVDGVILSSGALVRFPPHMSEQLVQAVSPGDTIQALGRPEPNGQDLKAYRIVNRNSGATVVESPPEWTGHRGGRHRRDAAMQPMSAEGTVQRLLTGRHGETHGVILDDGVIVRFPRHLHYAGGSMQVGQSFSATGYGSRTRYGAAMEAETIGGMAPVAYGHAGSPRR